MKISKSKQELARIISENGGWRDGAEWSIQDRDKNVEFMTSRPEYMKSSGAWCAHASRIGALKLDKLLPNWHQTILSRAEYFFLYQEQGLEDDLNEDWPDADGWIEWGGGECPVDKYARIDIRMTGGTTHYDTDTHWGWNADSFKITHYRLHKPQKSEPQYCESVTRSIPEPIAAPTIEQLASDYRNAKDYADCKQQEADAAKADADAKLAELVAAGKALGLDVSPITTKQEPELVITDWRDLRVGDRIWVGDSGYDNNCPAGEYDIADRDHGDDGQPVGVMWSGRAHWPQIHERGWRFIRRP